MIEGIDISDFQDGLQSYFGDLKRNGVGFIYAKSTQGTAFVSSTYDTFSEKARAAGIPFGAYHFFDFSASPIDQAYHFLNATQVQPGDLVPMVDVEVGPFAVEPLAAFNEEVEKTIGTRLVIYTGLSFWNTEAKGTDAFSGHPLWIAEYNGDAEPELPQGWTDWALWQYSSTGTVGAYPGQLDLDRAKELLTIK